MNERPKLKPALTRTDKLMELLGWLFIAAIWVIVLSQYSSLPERIPGHFNFAGEVDRMDRRASIIALPIIATILFLGLTLLNGYPWLFNYIAPVTADNAERQYRNATRMLRYIKTVLPLTFLVGAWQTMRLALHGETHLGPWFLISVFALILLPLMGYIIRSYRLK